MAANDPMGTVEGSGTYNEGATVTIKAIPNTGFSFVKWDDDNTDNPRTITVSANMTYIADFEVNTSINDVDFFADVSVYLNPTTRMLNVDDDLQKVEVMDATGRYMMRITTSHGVAIHRVILR